MNKGYKDITLIFTIHKIDFEMLNKIINFYTMAKKELINIHILIDNPDFQFVEYTKACIDNDDLFYNKKNMGKFLSIINHINKNYIKTSHFKTVDPDDFINAAEFKKIAFEENDNIIFLKENFIEIIKDEFDGESVRDINKIENYKKYKNTDWDSLYRKRIINKISFPTSTTILPIRQLKNKKIITILNNTDTLDINYAEDQLLGSLCFSLNNKITFADNDFYHYVINNNSSGS